MRNIFYRFIKMGKDNLMSQSQNHLLDVEFDENGVHLSRSAESISEEESLLSTTSDYGSY